MYRFFVAVIRVLIRILWGIEVEGVDNIPHGSGAIVAGNHTTWFDPVAIAVAIPRPVHFMGKAELFKVPILGWLFSRAHVFPVRRGLADRQAIRTAQERVTQGHLVGMFPEGTRNKEGDDLHPLQGGAALISIKTGAPVIPVVVPRVRLARLRTPIQVRIGEPIDLGGPKRASKSDITTGNAAISAQFRWLLGRNNQEDIEIQSW